MLLLFILSIDILVIFSFSSLFSFSMSFIDCILLSNSTSNCLFTFSLSFHLVVIVFNSFVSNFIRNAISSILVLISLQRPLRRIASKRKKSLSHFIIRISFIFCRFFSSSSIASIFSLSSFLTESMNCSNVLTYSSYCLSNIALIVFSN